MSKTSRKKLGKPNCRIGEVSFDLGDYGDADEDELNKLLHEFNAEIGGSGAGFGSRDLSVYAYVPQLKRMTNRIKKFFKKNKVECNVSWE